MPNLAVFDFDTQAPLADQQQRQCLRSGLWFTPKNNERIHPQIKIWQTHRWFADCRDEVKQVITQGKTEGWTTLEEFEARVFVVLRHHERPLSPWEEVCQLMNTVTDNEVEIPRYASPTVIYKHRIGVAFNVWSDQYLCIAELFGILSVWKITEWVAPKGSEGIDPLFVNMSGDRYGVQYHGHDRASRMLELLPQCAPAPVDPLRCWVKPENGSVVPVFPNAVFATTEVALRYGYQWEDSARLWKMAHSPTSDK